jgi:hypothetical protein
MEQVFLENYGYIKDKIPNFLFEKIKKESANLKNAQEFYTEINGNGVPTAVAMKENLEEWHAYISKLVHEYFLKFPRYSKYHSALTHDVPVKFGQPWYNLQKKYEFIPNHFHDGILGYSSWINIPYNIEKEHSKQGVSQYAGCFELSYASMLGNSMIDRLFLDKSWEGTIILFPAKMLHCVYPFYTSDEVRISLSGNVLLNTSTSHA